MSMLSRLKNWRLAHRLSEGDAPADTEGVAATREVGGDPDGGTEATTGTGENDTFVGRVAGADEGYAGTTGAEVRADAERKKEQED